jgi:hypothetical protein
MCWDRADLDSMKMEINMVNWDREFGYKNAEESWNRFKEILSDCTDKYVPKIAVNSAGKQRWVTQEIIKLIRMKKRRWKEYRLYKSNEARLAYEAVEKDLKKKIRKRKEKKRENWSTAMIEMERNLRTMLSQKQKSGPALDH